jgi:hypothetical protein
MPRLFLQDGYTLEGKTEPTYGSAKGLPVVTFAYRPADPAAIYEWQWKGEHAASGADRLNADADLVAGCLVSWDVQDATLDKDTIKKVPNPILQQIISACATWAAKEMAAAAGNS